jgi:hypothetical protein
MECYAFWSKKCTFWILKNHEWDFSALHFFYYCLHRWCFDFLSRYWSTLETSKHISQNNSPKWFSSFCKKNETFQTHVQFLGYKIQYDQVLPDARVIEFADKFPDEIREKKQLQRFLGCLNYVSDFYNALAKNRKILTERLMKNPPA